ncbi:MAG TPA: DUF2231 domain-containing protein [Anaerolineales bacterium]|nr:DUF2231 domain-containing protein [Anaerolineales bacterium]
MERRVKLFGHPVHPMLIVFPLGLLASAVIFDILYSIVRKPVLAIVFFYMIVSGVVGGLLAAIFGLVDWLAIPRNSRAKRIGAWHGLGNFVIVVLYAISARLRGRRTNFVPDQPAKLLALTGSGLALITAWIGGELVYRLGVGVDPGANLDAPSSLTEGTSGSLMQLIER